jgi:hypothetical protein
VWRIRIDTSTGWLALEVRDSDLLLAHFYTLRCPEHELHQLPLPNLNTWWMGLEDTHKELVYLHGYGDRKLGQHKGIWALSAATGEERWHLPDLSFYGMDQQGLLAREANNPDGPLLLAESPSGSILEKDITQKDATERVETYSRMRYAGVEYPMLYREGEAYFEQVRAFLAQQLDCEPVSAIEYAETDSCLVVSYYTRSEENKLDNFLAVFDLNGFLHLNELLAGVTDGVGSDTFFIFMRSLYFVQHKTTLKAYSLNFIVTT